MSEAPRVDQVMARIGGSARWLATVEEGGKRSRLLDIDYID